LYRLINFFLNMLQQRDILNYLKSNKELFNKQFKVVKIGIFGSYARNEQTDNSDIDIIIEMHPDTTEIFEKRLSLKETISNHFSKSVDVCHEKAIKPVFKEMIQKEAIYV
jgi:uncharacterized protein